MPEHVLMSEIKIITDGGHRRRWTAAEKLRVEFFCQTSNDFLRESRRVAFTLTERLQWAEIDA